MHPISKSFTHHQATHMNTAQAEKQDKDHEKTFKILVNGRQRDVTTDVLSFDDVVRLAYGEVPKDDSLLFTVLYHHADQRPSDGELVAGDSVKIKNNTSFDVTKTIRS